MAEVAESCGLARLLVDRECKRTKDRTKARKNVARALGVPPGTIENLQRERSKRVDGWLRDALRARVIRELEAEVVRLQHELAILKHANSDVDASQATAARADLSAVMAALGRGE